MPTKPRHFVHCKSVNSLWNVWPAYFLGGGTMSPRPCFLELQKSLVGPSRSTNTFWGPSESWGSFQAFIDARRNTIAHQHETWAVWANQLLVDSTHNQCESITPSWGQQLLKGHEKMLVIHNFVDVGKSIDKVEIGLKGSSEQSRLRFNDFFSSLVLKFSQKMWNVTQNHDLAQN